MSVGRTGPWRMCVGCRTRAIKQDLLRLVMVEGVVVPDPRGQLPGRGASVHPSVRCLDLAERRRAFSRAFRLREPPDLGRLREYVAALPGASGRPRDYRPPAAGRQQDVPEDDEHRFGSRSRLR